MSFVSTYNSLSVNGWSADSAGTFSLVSQINSNVGEAVAISQNGLYAIASNTNSNSAGIIKVYTINNTSVLTPQANIIGNNSPIGQVVTKFGTSLDIDYDGTRLVGGAPQNGLSNTQFGCARIYVRSGNSWSLEQQVGPPVGNTNQLGYQTTINNGGSTIVVGQIGFGGANSEIIYSYSRSGNTWSLLANIPKPTNAGTGSFWGSTIAMDALNTFVAGAPRDTTSGINAGAAYVYNTSGTQLAQLIPSDAAANTSYGIQVAISNDGNTIAIGSAITKKVFLFKGSGSSWTEVANIGNTYAPSQPFPQEIALSADGKTIFISAAYANGETAYDQSILHYQDISNSNNWEYQQTITNTNVTFLGYTIDTNDNGTLLVTNGGPGGGGVVGNIILYGQ
jgi:hypothetical protein